MPTCPTLLQPLLDLRGGSGAGVFGSGLVRWRCQGSFESWRTLMQSLFIFILAELLRSWGSMRHKLYFAWFFLAFGTPSLVAIAGGTPHVWSLNWQGQDWQLSVPGEAAFFPPQCSSNSNLQRWHQLCPAKTSRQNETTRLELLWKAPAPSVWDSELLCKLPASWVFSGGKVEQAGLLYSVGFVPCTMQSFTGPAIQGLFHHFFSLFLGTPQDSAPLSLMIIYSYLTYCRFIFLVNCYFFHLLILVFFSPCWWKGNG